MHRALGMRVPVARGRRVSLLHMNFLKLDGMDCVENDMLMHAKLMC